MVSKVFEPLKFGLYVRIKKPHFRLSTKPDLGDKNTEAVPRIIYVFACGISDNRKNSIGQFHKRTRGTVWIGYHIYLCIDQHSEYLGHVLYDT